MKGKEGCVHSLLLPSANRPVPVADHLSSMLRDIEYIISKISKIDCFGDTGEFLLRIARSKEVKPVIKSPATTASATASPSLAPQSESSQPRVSSDGRQTEDAESATNSPRVSGEGS